MPDPTPQDYERARVAIPCNGCGAESDDGYLHDEYCPAQKWEAVAAALAEQRERVRAAELESAAEALESATYDEIMGGVPKWLRARAAAIRGGE